MRPHPAYDPSTEEYFFKGKWYSDWESVEQAIDAYMEYLVEQYEAKQEEERLGLWE